MHGRWVYSFKCFKNLYTKAVPLIQDQYYYDPLDPMLYQFLEIECYEAKYTVYVFVNIEIIVN